ncbi:siderophore-interacting protein [Pseudonocardia kongjuensis]|uniref:Siderophore-interacting protein n=1 Tax=Pseudonocardia kongjuensis TaxID=102227 RepID=A0ABN1YAL7_9PSEU
MPYWITTVRDVRRITPHMVRVVLDGDELAGYQAKGLADDYCRVLFPHPGEDSPVVPVEIDGTEQDPPGAVPAPVRNYTIRRHDPDTGEVWIDLLLHEGGIGAGWAAQARPGARIALGPAHGRYQPPDGTRRVVLVGDATALPAIGRILDELPAGRSALAVILVADAAEEQELPAGDGVEIRWLHVPDPAALGERLLAEVQSCELAADGTDYVWVAGETDACRLARKHLRHERGLPAGAYTVVGYWRPDAERWQARYDALAEELAAKLAIADAENPDDDDYDDAVDRIYTDAGL